MAEDPDNLGLDHLRAIRGDMARMAEAMRDISVEMRAMRQHLSGVVTLQDHDHGDLTDIKQRLERIERRLDLVD